MCWEGEERSMGKGKGRCGGVKKQGEVWKSIWGENGEVCWSEGESMGGVGKVRGDGGVKKWGGRSGS